jgi:AraC-like DNA-binding protein
MTYQNMLMQVIHTPATLFCLIAVVLCLLTGIVLLAFSPHVVDNKANRFLGAAFICFSISLTVIYLVLTRLILYTPHFYRLGNVCWLLYIPLSYLYVRTAVKRQPPAWSDLIHLLPALIYLVDLSPFIFSSTANKLSIIKADLYNLNLVTSFRQGWLLPPDFHVPARTWLSILYWVLQLNLLKGIEKNIKRQNPLWFRWQLIYNFLQLLIFGPAIVSIIAGHSVVWSTSIPPAAGILLSAITLYLYPQILYGVQNKTAPPPTPSPPPPTPSPPIRQKPTLDEEIVKQLTQSLIKLMKEHKPFLNSNYSLKELAIDLNIPTHQASAFINQAIGKNFNDYLNYQRIEYCLRFIKEGKAANLNIHGISQACGFNNRNTFTNAFKKFTGKLPSEYIAGSESRYLQ